MMRGMTTVYLGFIGFSTTLLHPAAVPGCTTQCVALRAHHDSRQWPTGHMCFGVVMLHTERSRPSEPETLKHIRVRIQALLGSKACDTLRNSEPLPGFFGCRQVETNPGSQVQVDCRHSPPSSAVMRTASDCPGDMAVQRGWFSGFMHWPCG